MHFDALTLAAVADELNDTLLQGRVQNVVLPDEWSVGLEIYAQRQRRYLLVSGHSQASRVHLVGQKLRRGVQKQTPLLLLLRKYVRGAILDAIEQPDPFDRVLFLRFDHPQQGISTLVAEPMGRLSNVALLDAGGNILDVLNRVPPGEHVQRVLLPKRAYEMPPPQDKLPPLDDGRANYYERLGAALQAEDRLWRALLFGVSGVSPTLAREIAWRVAGDVNAAADTVEATTVAAALQALWQLPGNGAWTPGVTVDEAGNVTAFAPYELSFRDTFIETEWISQAVEQFYAEKRRDSAGAKDAYAGLRNNVAALIQRAVARVERQLAALGEDEPEPGEPEALRLQAEWLLALSSQVEPEQSTLTVDLGERTLQIPLSSDLTPVEQAERLFHRAAKLERAAKIIPVRRARLETDRAFLDQLQTDLILAQNQPEIAAVQEELRTAGFLRTRAKHRRQGKAPRSQPMRFMSAEGFAILVGRNARQNDLVTFEEANAEDLWLHVRDVPGAHVVIRCGGQTVSEETLEAAAQLAAYFSSLRGESGVPVAVTQKRFVTRMAGGRPGQVHYRNEETRTVAAQMPDL